LTVGTDIILLVGTIPGIFKAPETSSMPTPGGGNKRSESVGPRSECVVEKVCTIQNGIKAAWKNQYVKPCAMFKCGDDQPQHHIDVWMIKEANIMRRDERREGRGGSLQSNEELPTASPTPMRIPHFLF
jgi:hypothetical protein